jgi:glucose-6-phosphate-specific signal transduction histidine kinase
VRLAYEEDGVRLTVVDDGVGMPPAAECVGFGLRSMRERVESVGGVVEVRSGGGGGGGLGGGGGGVTLRGGADARGTRVAAEVPYT